MNLFSNTARLMGALSLTLGSTAAFATAPDALFKIGLDRKPAELHVDQQGSLFRVQAHSGTSSAPSALAKIAADGSPIWEAQFSGYRQNYSFDGQGNTYVALNEFVTFLRTDVGKVYKVDTAGQKQEIFPGVYSQTGFGAHPYTDVDDQQQLYMVIGKEVRKFNTDGSLAWTSKVAHHSRYGQTDIEVDHAGNSYTTYFGRAYAPQGVVYGTKLYKHAPDGTQLWVTHLPFRVGPDAIRITSNNQLIIVSEDNDAVIYKLDSDGNQLAAQPIARADLTIKDSQLDAQDNLVIAGGAGGSFAVRKLDSDLVEQWSATRAFITASGYNYGATAVALDIGADGSVYVTGSASTGSHHSNQKFATTKFDSAGNEVWTVWETDSSAMHGWGSEIAVQGNDVYVTGPLQRYMPVDSWFLKYGLSNQPPVANAGFYLPQECAGALTQVVLDGTGSSDPDGDQLSYSWSGAFGTVTGATPTVNLPLGEHQVTLTVDDGTATSSATVTILVQDTTSPVVDAGADQVIIAQNAAGAPFTPNYSASDTCGAVTVTVDPLLASYPVGSNLITVTATDASGNVASDTTTLTVAYASGDFLPPLRAGGVYKLGRTLPVKFQLFYADGSVVSTATPTLQLQQLSNNEPVGEPIDPQSSATAEPSNTFRFSDDQYIYNLDTSSLSKGNYRLLVDLGDGNGYKTIDIAFK